MVVIKNHNDKTKKFVLIINPKARNCENDLIPALQSEAAKFQIETHYLEIEDSEIKQEIKKIICCHKQEEEIILIRHGGDGSHRLLFEVINELEPDLASKITVIPIGGGTFDTLAHRLGLIFLPHENLRIVMNKYLYPQTSTWKTEKTMLHPIILSQGSQKLYCLFGFVGAIAEVANNEYAQKRGILRGIGIFIKGLFACLCGYPKRYKTYLTSVKIKTLTINGEKIEHFKSLIMGFSSVPNLIPKFSRFQPFGSHETNQLPVIFFRSYTMTPKIFVKNVNALATDKPITDVSVQKISAEAATISIMLSGDEPIALNLDGDPKSLLPNIPTCLEINYPGINYLSLKKN